MRKLVIGCIVAAICLAAFTYINRPRYHFKLNDGSELEVFHLKYSDRHEFDLRPFPIRIYELLPWKLREKITWQPLNNYDWAALGPSKNGRKGVGVGLRYVNIGRRVPDLSDEVKWVLSDDSGWYFSGFEHGIKVGEHARGAVFDLVPRNAERLKLSLFLTTNRFDPGELLGGVELPNPGFTPQAAKLIGTGIPASAENGQASVELLGLHTGISLPEIPLQLANRFQSITRTSLTPSVRALVDGEAKAAVFPNHARSALVFRPYFSGTAGTAALRAIKFSINDGFGKPDTYARTLLYKDERACVLVWDYNLPVNIGNYDIELTLYEDPSDDSAWVEMPPLTPNASDINSSQALAFGSNIIHAGMTGSNSRIDFTATEDPTNLAIRALHTETSTPLQLSTLQGGSWRDPYRSYADLSEPLTSGTVTLHFARCREHTIKFSGVPRRPESAHRK